MADFETEFLYDIKVEIDTTQDLGATPHGHRMINYFKGGSFEGPRLRGEVLPGGADWLLERPDGANESDIRGAMRTDDGALIYGIARGIVTQDYFRLTYLFETGSEKYGWLNRIVAVGIGRVTDAGVTVSVYAVR